MNIFLITILCISLFIIVWSMAGYGLFLKLLDHIIKKKPSQPNSAKPTVSVIIVAHNEEKVILQKLINILDNDYPKEKIEYIISSDFSTDSTVPIVNEFINNHPESKILLHQTEKHLGKTNAQNEGQKLASGEILVFTDANSIFKSNTIRELVSSFTEDDIAYVSGRLDYRNEEETNSSTSEKTYWDSDLELRRIESKIYSITAGNGAVYACRNRDYHDFRPIQCHDSCMPFYYVSKRKKAIYNSEAIAFEKAGETNKDEFKRKVRMNRLILEHLKNGVKALNLFKYKWFSFFYFGHRTSRYLLWLAHLLLFVSSFLLFKQGIIFQIIFVIQVIFYCLAFVGWAFKSKKFYFRLPAYYLMTILAQWKAIFNSLTGRNKPTWDKAESTR